MANDPYINPIVNFPTGSYTWVPALNPTYGDTPFGFLSLKISPGKFRNDWPGTSPETYLGVTINPTVNIQYKGTLSSPIGSQNWPILSAYRPLENPNPLYTIPSGSPCVINSVTYSITISGATDATYNGVYRMSGNNNVFGYPIFVYSGSGGNRYLGFGNFVGGGVNYWYLSNVSNFSVANYIGITDGTTSGTYGSFNNGVPAMPTWWSTDGTPLNHVSGMSAVVQEDIPTQPLYIISSIADNGPMSNMKFEYSLVIDISDTGVLNALSTSDFNLAQKYILGMQNNTNPEAPGIDWSQYNFGQVLGYSGTTSTEYPISTDGKTLGALAVTGFSYNGTLIKDTPLNKTIYFGPPNNPTALSQSSLYPDLSEITIGQRTTLTNITSMSLSIYNVKLFNAQAVNPDPSQTPCTLLQYAFQVGFQYDPTWPSDISPLSSNFNLPNLHIKVFSPDSPVGSPGFAHSINLRFIIFSIEDYAAGAAAGASGGIIGVESGVGASIYYTTFSGIMPGTQSANYIFLSTPIGQPLQRMVPIDFGLPTVNITSLTLQKALGYSENSAPPISQSWTTLKVFSLSDAQLLNFLYADLGATRTDWYTLIYTFSNGVMSISQPFQNQLSVETEVLQFFNNELMVATNPPEVVTRRVLIEDPTKSNFWNTVSSLSPFILYEAQDSFPLSSPILINSGAWDLKFRAYTDDVNGYFYTHIFARMWFVPDGENIETQPYQYRITDEIHFEWTPGTANIASVMAMKPGPPSSLDQCFVSAPISTTDTWYDLTRYTDQFGTNGQYTPTFNSSNPLARLVVGLYTFSYLSEAGIAVGLNQNSVILPHISIELDSNYDSLTTTITQSLSGQLLPQRASRYNSSYYVEPDSAYTVTNLLVNETIVENPTIYSNQINIAPNITNAFSNLFTLLTAEQIAAKIPTPSALNFTVNESYSISSPNTIVIPVSATTYATTGPTQFNSVDFVTDGQSLGMGRISNTLTSIPATPWKIILTQATPDTKNVVASFISFSGYLASSDGTILEQIFSTEWLCNYYQSSAFSSATPASTLTFNVDIENSYNVSGNLTQFVLRMNVHSQYIKTPTVSSIQTPVQIQSLTISTPTIEFLDINQTASFGGSPSFYEDLPLVPNSTYGSNQWFFVVDSSWLAEYVWSPDENNSTILFDGTLYSPVFYCTLSKDIEINVDPGSLASGLSYQNIWLRTVPGSSTTQQSYSLSATQNPLTHTIHLVSDEIISGVSNVWHRGWRNGIFSSDGQTIISPTISVQPNGYNQSVLNNIPGTLPSICIYKSIDKKYTIALVTQANDSNNSTTIALNIHDGQPTDWIGPNYGYHDREFGIIRHLTEGINNPVVTSSQHGGTLYVAGYISPGSIVVKCVNPFDANSTGGLVNGPLYLVDGSPNITLTAEQNIIVPTSSQLTGTANNCAPGILVNNKGMLLVSYTIQGSNGNVWLKYLTQGQFSKAHQIISLAAPGVTVTSDFQIYGPTLVYNKKINIIFAAFWVGGKILVGPIKNPYADTNPICYPFHLVAGNSNFTSGISSTNSMFNQLVQADKVVINITSGDTSDVPQQRPGMFVSNDGSIFVFYQTQDGSKYVRKLRPFGLVGAPYKIPTIPSNT